MCNSPPAEIHSLCIICQTDSFSFRTQGSVLNLDRATRDPGSLSGNSRANETCSLWHQISVQIPTMPSVKGLHYALRIWTTQIFGLVIMMLYPLPQWNQVPHQAQCFCIPEMAHPTPPLATLRLQPKGKKYNISTTEEQRCITLPPGSRGAHIYVFYSECNTLKTSSPQLFNYPEAPPSLSF